MLNDIMKAGGAQGFSTPRQAVSRRRGPRPQDLNRSLQKSDPIAVPRADDLVAMRLHFIHNSMLEDPPVHGSGSPSQPYAFVVFCRINDI